MDLQLKGKKALVTGGSRGIGKSIAERLAAEGCHVAICARNAKQVEAEVARLKKSGVKAFGRAIDVSDGKALSQWVEESAKALGGIDIIVANVSAMADGGKPADFRRAFDTDFMHTVHLVEAAMPMLERSKAGNIIAISSISGSEDYGFDQSSYGSIKAALFYYVKSLANHLAPQGIRANVVSPGTTYFKGGFWHDVELNQPKAFAEAMAGNPMGRMAKPEDIANAVAFLVSGAAGFITGVNLVVDGGFTKRVQT
jgi:NAD(P)-dependent dehydrogenase (short-subunit alcohol dehydrogenase family)